MEGTMVIMTTTSSLTFQPVLERIAEEIERTPGRGRPADYIPALGAKSGVGGGIIAVVPGRCTLCVWSPGLDERGNSVAGVAALDRFTTLTGLSVF